MAKILERGKVDPSSGCKHVVRGETEAEVLKKKRDSEQILIHSNSCSKLRGKQLRREFALISNVRDPRCPTCQDNPPRGR
jgi:hypothetical protein